jgi:uncharacterized protein (TIGR03083 family)
MNAAEQLENSHVLAIQALDDLRNVDWDIPNACGTWSVKDVVAHLASYEHLLLDVLHTFLGDASDAPYLSEYAKNSQAFNDAEVAKRAYHTAQQVVDEYEETHAEAVSLLEQMPVEKLSEKGTMPWNKERSLNDLVASLSNHTQRHCDEIIAFRKRENM